MKHLFQLTAPDGRAIDATIELSDDSVVLQSRGGTTGTPNSRNPEYNDALKLILEHLEPIQTRIVGAWVDSSRVQDIPLDKRTILYRDDLPMSSGSLYALLGVNMSKIGQKDADKLKGGNRQKRIKIGVENCSVAELSARLSATPLDRASAKSALLVPYNKLRGVVDAEEIWAAFLELQNGANDPFGESRDYDVVVADGVRMAPKALFGFAASKKLGFQLKPENFQSGFGKPCFDTLIECGLDIVPKNSERFAPELLSSDEEKYCEGLPRLKTHMVRERDRGLRKAKLAAFKKANGALICEKCGMDPEELYGEAAESAIEVHHIAPLAGRDTHRPTSLDELQCLCASCHRVEHYWLRVKSANYPKL